MQVLFGTSLCKLPEDVWETAEKDSEGNVMDPIMMDMVRVDHCVAIPILNSQHQLVRYSLFLPGS